jgi:hypothetical protein
MIENSYAQTETPFTKLVHALLFQAQLKVSFSEVELLAAKLNDEIETVIESGHDSRISDLYWQLHVLTRRPASPAREQRWRELTRELRILQEAEAERLEAYFESNSPLSSGSVDEAIRRADELLATHAHLASSNDTGHKTD